MITHLTHLEHPGIICSAELLVESLGPLSMAGLETLIKGIAKPLEQHSFCQQR